VAPQAVVGVSTFFFSYGKPENTLSYGFGYFGGGFGLPYVNTIDRLDFSNETVSAPSNRLTQARDRLAAVSNSNYGYFGGGGLPTNIATIDRVEFSTNTTSAASNNLPQAKSSTSAVSSPRGYGYFGGGYTPLSVTSSTINRLDFATETTETPGAYQLTEGRYSLTASSNSNYGYFVGGRIPTAVCTIDRLDFYSETILNPTVSVEQLSQARYNLAAVSNSNYGYFGGGFAPSLPGQVCTIDRLDFSNETVSAPGNYQLTQARQNLAAVSNSNYGYFGGGYFEPPLTHYCTIDRLDFSNETVTGPPIHGINLTQRKTALAGVSSPQYGYFGGGSFNSPLTYFSTIDRLDFSTETVAAPDAYQLTQARDGLAGVSNSNYGYFAGGFFPEFSTIDRLDFSSETTSAPGNNLTQARDELAGVSNSNYGYFGGGFAPSLPGFTCIIDRLDFSNETVSAPGTYQLTQARSDLAAVSN
jgi:hypothetical protein